MMPDLKQIVNNDTNFKIMEQELGGRQSLTKHKTRRGKGAVGNMRYDEITSKTRVFTTSDIDKNNPYTQQGILNIGDNVVAVIKEILKDRIKDLNNLTKRW